MTSTDDRPTENVAAPNVARTQVAIVGAGPAGLVLACLLLQSGVRTIVLERRGEDRVASRARAALLEFRTVAFLQRNGLASATTSKAPRHGRCTFLHDGETFSVPYGEMTGGRDHYICPQDAVVRELIDAVQDLGGTIMFSTEVTDVQRGNGSSPAVVRAVRAEDRKAVELSCDFVALADGGHGVSDQFARAKLAPSYVYQHVFRWLALLAQAPPFSSEIVYGTHRDGFTGQMPRTAEITRYYIQCADHETIGDWPDQRIWDVLSSRCRPSGQVLVTGAVMDKRILGTSSYVRPQMRHERVFLLGDAAHLIAPAGGKGMNLAVADAEELAEGLRSYYNGSGEERLSGFMTKRLPKIWKAANFSQWLIELTHRPPDGDPNAAFTEQLRVSRIEQLRSGNAMASMFADAYAGDPT